MFGKIKGIQIALITRILGQTDANNYKADRRHLFDGLSKIDLPGSQLTSKSLPAIIIPILISKRVSIDNNNDNGSAYAKVDHPIFHELLAFPPTPPRRGPVIPRLKMHAITRLIFCTR